MDRGIRGKNALVCGASRGLGKACALALAREGVNITIVARNRDVLENTGGEIERLTGAAIAIVAADLATKDGRAAAISACPRPDILVNNSQGPSPGNFREWSREDWLAALDDMMLGPIEMMRLTVDGMMERGFGRIVNIVSRSVKIPQIELGIERRTAQYRHIRGMLTGTNKTFEELYRERADASPAKRYGDPAELGAYCAFLCSSRSGYITGQSLLIDGGSYPGTF